MSKFLKDKLEKSFFAFITLAYALSLCHLYYMQTSHSYYCPLNDLPEYISTIFILMIIALRKSKIYYNNFWNFRNAFFMLG